MQILAISGSLRAGSTNSNLLRAAAALAPNNVKFTFYDGLTDLPHFSPELDGDNPPASVIHLRESLQVADGVLICTPEYAFGVPGSLKNVLDWTVSTCAFSDKPVAVISASSTYMGGEKAHASLLLTLTALGANILEPGLTIAAIRTKMNYDGEITHPATVQSLKSVVLALVQASVAS
jgi:NAD(P)H-dependent FMN reductase